MEYKLQPINLTAVPISEAQEATELGRSGQGVYLNSARLLELADLALGFKKPKIKKKKASAGIHSHEKTEPYSS